MNDPAISEEDKLQMVATICEALPREELNRDVAHGIAFAVGYIGMVGAETEVDDA